MHCTKAHHPLFEINGRMSFDRCLVLFFEDSSCIVVPEIVLHDIFDHDGGIPLEVYWVLKRLGRRSHVVARWMSSSSIGAILSPGTLLSSPQQVIEPVGFRYEAARYALQRIMYSAVDVPIETGRFCMDDPSDFAGGITDIHFLEFLDHRDEKLRQQFPTDDELLSMKD